MEQPPKPKTEEEKIRERLSRERPSEKKQTSELYGVRTREDGLVECYKYTKSVSMIGVDNTTQTRLVHETPLYQSYIKSIAEDGPFTMDEVSSKPLLKSALECFSSLGKPIHPQAPPAKEKKKHMRQTSLFEARRKR